LFHQLMCHGDAASTDSALLQKSLQ
jgi:hypothetical protein